MTGGDEGVTPNVPPPPHSDEHRPASFLPSVASIMALCWRFAAAVGSCGGTFRLLQ